MCITPLPPWRCALREGSHGSILSGNYPLNRLTSKWKSTMGRLAAVRPRIHNGGQSRRASRSPSARPTRPSDRDSGLELQGRAIRAGGAAGPFSCARGQRCAAFAGRTACTSAHHRAQFFGSPPVEMAHAYYRQLPLPPTRRTSSARTTGSGSCVFRLPRSATVRI